MKLPGHKSACKCVGCSPATRKRGMAKLKNWARSHRNKDAKYPKDVWGGGSRKARRKKARQMYRIAKGEPTVTARMARRYGNRKLSRHGNPIVPDWLTARKTAIAMSKREGKFYFAKKAPGGYEIMASKAAPFGRRKAHANRGKTGRPFRAMHARVAKSMEKKRREYLLSKETSRRKFAGMLGNSGQWRRIGKVEESSRAAKLAKALRKRTPQAETRIIPATDGYYHVEARMKSGTHVNRRRSRRRNPAYGYGGPTKVTWNRKRRNPAESGQFIGSAPSLSIAGGGAQQFPRGVLKTGPDANTVRLILGGSPAPRAGSRVTRIEYDDPVKAVNAYKEIGRFRHDCADPFIVGPAQGGSVLLTSKSKAWQGD